MTRTTSTTTATANDIFEIWDSQTPIGTNAFYGGNEVKYNIIQAKGKKTSVARTNKFMRSQMARIYDDHANMKFQVSYQSSTGLWYSSKWFDDGSFVEPDLSRYGIDEHDIEISKVMIKYITKPTKGGSSLHNDCLYNAIKFALGTTNSIAYLPKCPSTVKEWINIGRDEPIDYNEIHIIENKIKCNISVVGDYEQPSACDYPRKIVVKLENGHYSYQNNMNVRNQLVKYKNLGKTYVLFMEQDNDFMTYDGEELLQNKQLKYDDLNKSKNCIYKKYKPMEPGNCSIENKNKMKELINKIKDANGDRYKLLLDKLQNELHELENTCLVEYYKEFMTNCETLKQLTEGKIDMKEHGYDIKNCVLTQFWKTTKTYEFEDIDEKETEFLGNTNNFGLTFAEPHEGQFNVYDANSFYPSLMKDPKLLLPCGKPTYHTITEFKKIIKVGIYHCLISGFDRKLFSPNVNNYYTYIDVKRAIELNYEVQLVIDGQPNAMLYPKCIKAHLLFADYVDKLFPLKDKSPLIKSMLNRLWGSLCERTKSFKSPNNNDKYEKDFADLENDDIYPRKNNLVIKTTKGFVHPHARIGYFLTAFGRCKMSKLVEPIQDTVYRIHTDGFYSTKTDIPVSKLLGKLKLEKSGSFKIISVNNIEPMLKLEMMEVVECATSSKIETVESTTSSKIEEKAVDNISHPAIFNISTLLTENYNVRNAFTNDLIGRAKAPCLVDKRTLVPSVVSYKDKTNEWFKNTLVIDDSCGYGLKCGRQMNGKYIICLDFDIYDKETKGDCKTCKKYLDDYNGVCGTEDGMYESSTEGNYNVLCDITECTDLINLCEQRATETFKPIPNCGLEFQITKHQVIPPTATPCKKTGDTDKRRQFSDNAYPFKIVQPTDNVHQYLGKLLIMTQSKPYIAGSDTIENKDETVIKQYTDMLMNGLNFHMADYNDYLKISGVMKTNGFSKELFCAWVATTNPKDDTHLDLWDAPCKYDKMSIFTLDNICKKLNPEFYKTWLAKWKINPTLELYKQFDDIFTVDILNSSVFTDGSIADAFKIAYGDKFRYCNKTVFHFNGVYWKPDNTDKSRLCCFIDTELYKLLMGYLKFKINYWTKKIDADNDAEQAKRVLDKIGNWKKVCDGVLSKLRNTKTRYCVATDICNKISNEEQKWNLNPNVFCFENRVIDITTGKKVVANPLDFINMSCGYDYDDKYSLDLVTELETLITSIQPEKKLKNYLMQVLSTSLMSEQIQAFFILTGKGGNGKSVLVELMVEMLGDYAYNLPSGFISKTIKEGGNPEASGMDCKRLVIVSEPESKDPICCATVKKITGDTKINVRPLYSNQTGIDLKCTVIMICNEKPALDEVNDAVSRRMRAGVIPFGEKFVSKNEFDGTSDEEKKQFNMKLGDVKYVSQKFKTEYKQALFMILLPYFRHYQKTLFSDAPPIVIKESKAYIKGCDNICEWFEENYEPSDDSMVFVEDLFYNYKSTDEYYQSSKEEKRKNGTAKKFKDILQGNLFIRKFYKEAKQYWLGIQYQKPFIAGWRKKVEVITIDDKSDTTTVVN